jgi:hypothetical protein
VEAVSPLKSGKQSPCSPWIIKSPANRAFPA